MCLAEYKQLLSLTTSHGDFKSILWIPLTLKQKFELFLKWVRPRERELLSLVFMLEFKLLDDAINLFYSKEINNIMRIDKYVEKTLNNLVYEKFMKLWETQTSNAQISKIEKHIKNYIYSLEDALSFIKFLYQMNEQLHEVNQTEVITFKMMLKQMYQKQNNSRWSRSLKRISNK